MTALTTLRFDAAELQTFLRAQIAQKGEVAARFPPAQRQKDADRRNGERGERARVMRDAMISRETFDRAVSGEPITEAEARRIWRAIGMNPDIRTLRGTDL